MSDTSFTQEEKEMLDRINDYANEVMPDIDPQKTKISVQLEKLKPVMEDIAAERGLPLEDIFIQYMDLASKAALMREQEFQDSHDNFDIPSNFNHF